MNVAEATASGVMAAGKTVLILGAGSAIARAVASEFARRGLDLLLAGRDLAEIETLAADLRLRHGVRVRGLRFDAVAFNTHPGFVEECRKASEDTLGGAVVCFGYLGDQSLAEKDRTEAQRILDTNLLGAVSILAPLADYFERRRGGFLCALSSVAGDRGRQSNYYYGAAKAGLNVLLQGLRQRLSRSGVQVTTIKPGFVDTAMTFGRAGMFLVASPETVGRKIVSAVIQGKSESYVPGVWRLIMFAVRSVPESIFKRMRL
jgi:short-subunit dehydrogenase